MLKLMSATALSASLLTITGAQAQEALLAEVAASCEVFQKFLDNENREDVTDAPVFVSEAARTFQSIATTRMIGYMIELNNFPRNYIENENYTTYSMASSRITDHPAFNAGVWYEKASGHASYLVRSDARSNTPRAQGQAARILFEQSNCRAVASLRD